MSRILLPVLLSLLPTLAIASLQEAEQLAGLLQQSSHDLAFNVAGIPGSGSVEHNIRQLADKASQLQDYLQRGRSSAYLRLRFSDVSRYYERVEAAMARLDGRNSTQSLQNQFARLALVYEQLRAQFYGESVYPGQVPVPAILVIQPPGRGPRYVRDENLGLSLPDSQRTDRQHRSAVQDRYRGLDQESRHRSPVLERQRRYGNTGTDGFDRSPRRADDARIQADQGYYRMDR